MNINRDIVARAMIKAGEEPLTDTDIEKNSAKWRYVKDFYLATILETLASTEWTSQIKRSELILSEEDNLTGYGYCYNLPADCSKPVELQDNADYLVEGDKLYTNIEHPILKYVSNNYTGKLKYERAVPQPTEDSFVTGKYYTYDDDAKEYVPAEEYDSELEFYTLIAEDYPLYDDYEFDSLLSEYIETRLASKLALKITGDTQLYQLLYNEAILKEREAVNKSIANAHNKDGGNRYWSDILGLPKYE